MFSTSGRFRGGLISLVVSWVLLATEPGQALTAPEKPERLMGLTCSLLVAFAAMLGAERAPRLIALCGVGHERKPLFVLTLRELEEIQ